LNGTVETSFGEMGMLSIVVSWRDRDELVEALPSLIRETASVCGEITIVNYGGSDERLRGLVGGGHGALRVVSIPGERYFNKAAAQNLGASVARHGTLFFCDCDIILPVGVLAEILDRLQMLPSAFATLDGVVETVVNARSANHVTSFGYILKISTADGRKLTIVDNEEDGLTGKRQAPGLLMARKEHFLSINGYNSKLHGWGWEDQDMISRLTLGVGLERITHGVARHISHDDLARMAHYPPMSSRWENRDRMFRQALANYDAGNFRGTFAEDRERLKLTEWTGAADLEDGRQEGG
jgi:glycosyl transferase family 7 (putative galactosyltransferase)